MFHNFPVAVWIGETENLLSLLDSIVQPIRGIIHARPRCIASNTRLGNERYKLSKVLSLFVGINLEYVANTVVVIPLLEKLFFVCRWISFDEVLELRKVGGK